MTDQDQTAENTDIELFSEDPNDIPYSPSCHMTKDRRLGIEVGGHVLVMELRAWHGTVKRENALEDRVKELEKKLETIDRLEEFRVCPNCACSL